MQQSGGVGLIEFCSRRWCRVAAIGAVMAALGLAACGRKGGLEPPPAAAVPAAPPVDQQSQGAPAPDLPQQSSLPAPVQAAPPPSFPQQSLLGGSPIAPPSVGGGSQSSAVAAPRSGKREPFILDWLLD